MQDRLLLEALLKACHRRAEARDQAKPMTDMLAMAQEVIRKNIEKRRLMSLVRLLRRPGLFDKEWYLKTNPDVAAAKINPLVHYLMHGAEEGRDPNENFSTRYYLAQNADVASSGVNPLVHYALEGAREGRRPHARVADGFESYPFGRLSRRGLAEVAEYLAHETTPAHLLARPDATLYSPRISIVLPVWNTPPQFLHEVLQSIYSQTYTDWELCVVDDSSSDKATTAVVRSLESDIRIKISRTPVNSGIAAASHMALMTATGDYVAFVDHDDILAPTALSDVVALLREDRKIDYVYSDHAQADARGLPRSISRKPEWSPEFLLATNYIVHFKVVRRQLLLDVGGLENERSFVQDLGMSLRLCRAGAKIKHLPRAAYYWREHGGSVAATTESKPGIEGLLVDEYNKHAKALGRATTTFWPKRFQRGRVGVFELAFPAEQPSTAIVAFLPVSSALKVEDIRSRLTPQLPAGAVLHLVALQASQDRDGVTVLKSDAAIKAFFRKLTSEYVVLMTAAGRCISPQGFSALTGYLQTDETIAAVGAKVLDNNLRVKAGGFLMLESGAHGLISGGNYDDDTGHWYINQIASNVDAVSQRCMAVRRKDLIEGSGLMLHRWGEFASLLFCRDMTSKGSRVVYNPNVKINDPDPVRLDQIKLALVREIARKTAGARTYKEM